MNINNDKHYINSELLFEIASYCREKADFLIYIQEHGCNGFGVKNLDVDIRYYKELCDWFHNAAINASEYFDSYDVVKRDRGYNFD